MTSEQVTALADHFKFRRDEARKQASAYRKARRHTLAMHCDGLANAYDRCAVELLTAERGGR